MLWTQIHASGEVRHSLVEPMVERGIGCDPALKFLKRGAASGHGFTLAAELHLPPGPLEEHHQLARHPHGDLAAEIFLDQRQREMSPAQRQVLFDNTARAVGGAALHIQERHIANCAKADPEYGAGVREALAGLGTRRPRKNDMAAE